MRILMDSAIPDHRNKGNNALLQVTMNRLKQVWPTASYEVLSISPLFSQTYLPGTIAVYPCNLQKYGSRVEQIHRLTPKLFWKLLFELRELVHEYAHLDLHAQKVFRLASPRQLHESEQGHIANKEINMPESELHQLEAVKASLTEQYAKIADYDLYIPVGGGYLCDTDKRFLLPLFDRLEAAITYGIPTVMVGQGVGPMEDKELLARASEVLPRVDYILIREEKVARPLLQMLKVTSGKILMTGDDAIELAYQRRRPTLGSGIGISLRLANYTGVDYNHLTIVRPIVQQAAKKYDAQLISAPISCYRHDSDIDYIKEIMRGYSKKSYSWQRYETPLNVIKRVGQCRIMISGTFHGAVFAISQGIPVVALAKSVEYANKMNGLAAEFGSDSCQVIHLNDRDLNEKLVHAIDFAWNAAEELRASIFANAQRQIAMGHAAYEKIYDLVKSKRWKKDNESAT